MKTSTTFLIATVLIAISYVPSFSPILRWPAAFVSGLFLGQGLYRVLFDAK
jgi:hypothetical protein